MTDLPYQVSSTLPVGVKVKTVEKASLSSPGVKLHSSSDRPGGSIGYAR